MNTTSLVSGGLAFLLTVLFAPIVIRGCTRRQLFDRPGPLKIHSRPVPRLGGVALVLALAVSIVFAAPGAAIHAWSFFAALALVWVTGLIDDLRGLPVLFRLAAQVAAAVLLWRAGWAVPFLPNNAISMLATAVSLIVFVNSFNFLDGTDGLAAGVAGIIAAAYALLLSPGGEPLGAVIASGVAGACVGFLPSNLIRAKLFLGDSGSTALGFSIAFLAFDLWRSSPTTLPRLAFPFLVAAIPLLDTALAVARRLSAGTSPWQGDRRHAYDVLLAKGWSSLRVALAFYAVTAALATVALWGVWRESAAFWLAAALAASMLILLAVRLGVLRSGGEGPSRGNVARAMDRETAGSD